MHTVGAVIFDLGRVLVRIHHSGEKFAVLMNALAIAPNEALTSYWRTDEVQAHMVGRMLPRDFYRAVMERTGLDWEFEKFTDAWSDIFQAMPGMGLLFNEVAQRYPVGLLSDTDPIHWEYLRRTLPWLGQVARPTLSFEVGECKPHPAMYAAAAANVNRSVQECLFIDDLAGNVEGARQSGMQALQFIDAETLRRDLLNLGIL